MCHAMHAFQMGGIFILHLASNTIAHALENIHSISPKGYQVYNNIYIIKTIMFFQSTHNNLGQIIYTPSISNLF